MTIFIKKTKIWLTILIGGVYLLSNIGIPGLILSFLFVILVLFLLRKLVQPKKELQQKIDKLEEEVRILKNQK
ncbi:hypothetical protein CHI08_26330 [Peribacillus simplex]|nr:hypothetical protein CHI08_26330 [Peribacillus simplex]